MTVEIIFGILLAGILSNNYALLHFLGTGAVLENERPVKRSLTLGLGTTVVMLISTLMSVFTMFAGTFILRMAGLI